MIGNEIEIVITEISGEQVKIGIQAPKNMKVLRKEVYLEIQKENQAAAYVNPRYIGELSNLIKKVEKK